MTNQPPSARHCLVIGGGSIGTRHARNLLSLGQSVTICEPRPERRAELAHEPGLKLCESLEAGLAEHPQLAVVAVPNHLHVPVALQAARAGCDLMIEKPLANTLSHELSELLAEVHTRSLISLVGCNLRFHPGLLKLQELIVSGQLGRVTALRAEAGQYLPDWHPWEDYRQMYSARKSMGGGALLDFIHEIDYARWLLGPVTLVSALLGNQSRLEIETEDTAALLLRFAGGAIGEIHVDYVQRTYARQCRVIGDTGTAHWDYVLGEVRWYTPEAGWQHWQQPADWQANDMYLEQMRHLLACLETRSETQQALDQGLAALEIALAALRSDAEQRHVRLEVPA